MDQNIQKALWLAVSVLLFVIVVTVGVMIFSQGMQLVEESEQSTQVVASNLKRLSYERYEGEVMGSHVLTAIKEFSENTGNFMIIVSTHGGGTHQFISTGNITAGGEVTVPLTEKTKADINAQFLKAKDPSNILYINPSGKFEGQILYDANDVVRAIRFDQK